MKTFIGSCIAAVTIFLPFDAFACDFEIASDVTVVDGDELGVQPGDMICLDYGDREHVELVNLTGTPDAPIVVRTQVGGSFGFGTTISPEERDEAVLIHSSRDVRLTGFRPVADDPDDYRIGLRITSSDASAGIRLYDVAGTIEIDHIIFYELAGHPIVAHAQPICSNDTGEDEPNGLTIHRLESEFWGGSTESDKGILIGDIDWEPLAEACAGQPIARFSFYEEVEFRDSSLRTPGEPLRIRGATDRCLISNNRLTSNDQNVVLDRGSACEITRNRFEAMPPALQLLEAGPAFIYNNYFVGGGIVVESNDSTEAPHRILFNTFLPTTRMLTARGPTTQNHQFTNNLADMRVAELSADDYIQGDLESWEVHHNLGVFGLPTIARTIRNERSIQAWMPYAETEPDAAGVATEDVTLDYFGNERPDPPTVGAAEALGRAPDDYDCIDYCNNYDPNERPHPAEPHEDEPDDPNEPDPSGEHGPPGEDSGPALDEGCGCSSSGSDATPLVLLLLMPAFLWRRKRLRER